MSTAEPPAPQRTRRVPWVAAALAALVLLAAVALVLVMGGEDDAPDGGAGTATTAGPQAGPRVTTPEALAALAERTEQPVYWVGPSPSRTYELTRTPDGATYLRYLPAGVQLGDQRPDFLTVGTYPVEAPYRQVREASRRPGAQVEELDDDGLAVANRSRPNSWYLARPGAKVLVEVFSPRAGRARELLRAGQVVPVEG